MDVKKISSFLFVVFLISCGSKSSSTSGSSNGSSSKNSSNCADTVLAGQKIIRWKNGKYSRHHLKKTSEKEFSSFVTKNKKNILYVENNFKITHPKSQSVQLLGWGGGLNWGVGAIKAQRLWDLDIKGDGVVVAVIDSGIDARHPQLSGQLYTNSKEIPNNNIDDDHNGLVDDVHGYDFTNSSGYLEDTTGHGTHVSGTIAADPDKGSITGVAPHAKILMYDFFSEDGDGSVYDAIQAMAAVKNSGARVVNASWGGPGCSQSLKDAIDELAKKDILFIAAAGNDGENIDTNPSYPAAYVSPALIAVGAMTVDEFTAGFSNYGKLVHLVAPGTNIESTYPPQTTAVESGTSMAAPHVTGAVALLWSAFPKATSQDIKNALINSVKRGNYPVSSRGSLDVSAAYDFLKAKFATLP